MVFLSVGAQELSRYWALQKQGQVLSRSTPGVGLGTWESSDGRAHTDGDTEEAAGVSDRKRAEEKAAACPVTLKVDQGDGRWLFQGMKVLVQRWDRMTTPVNTGQEGLGRLVCGPGGPGDVRRPVCGESIWGRCPPRPCLCVASDDGAGEGAPLLSTTSSFPGLFWAVEKAPGQDGHWDQLRAGQLTRLSQDGQG